MTSLNIAILLPNGWTLRAGPVRAFGLCWRLLALVVAVVAGAMLAIDRADMTRQVLHTLEYGPGG